MFKTILGVLIFGFSLHAVAVFAQKGPAKELTGTYMLQGVMETAAVFELKPDGTFDYGFMYGAADKWGKGRWKVAGKNVLLTSTSKQPEQDFTLKHADNSYKQGVRIKIVYNPDKPLPYIKCRLGEETATSDTKGEVFFRNMNSGTLEMYHPIYSNRQTRLNLNKSHTNFIILLATDLSEVYFKEFTMEASPNELIAGELPGMPPEDAAGKLKRYVFRGKK